MKIVLKLMLMVSGFVLVGCGGGGGSTSTNNNQNLLTQDNYMKYIRVLDYMENIDPTDIPEGGEGIVVNDNIDKNTGMGSIGYRYTNAPYKYGIDITGETLVKVTNVQKSIDSATIDVETNYNIMYMTKDNNITVEIEIIGTVKVTQQGEELVSKSINKYRVHDQKYNEDINIEINTNTENGKLYLSSEDGYVEFTNHERKYTLKGLDNSSLTAEFKDEKPIFETRYTDPGDLINGQAEPYQEKVYEPKEGQGEIAVTFDSQKMKNLYFVPIKVSKYEPPKFYENYGDASLLEYDFYSWHTKYKLLNNDLNNTHIKVQWFINDKKVDTGIQYELPEGSFKEGDTIKVVVTAIHGDIEIQKEQLLEGYDTNFNVSSGENALAATYDIEYRTNTLEFDLDILANEYISTIDVDNSEFSWYINHGVDSYKIINGTEYNKKPTILANSYGFLYEPLYLKIYTEHDIKVVRFNITLAHGNSGIGGNLSGDIISSIDEANITNNNYIATNTVSHIDLDNNGLDDLIYTSETREGSFLNISYQDTKKIFSLEKLHLGGRMYLGDYNGDGNKQALMFGSDENHSALVSLEKGNIHIIKDINLSNYQNRLNLQAVSDMNNDGKDDLIVADNQEDKLYIYENIDDLTQKRLVGVSVCKGIQAIKDINNDGLKDIICTPDIDRDFNTTTELGTKSLLMNYFLQKNDNTFELKNRKYNLIKDATFSQAESTRVYSGATMLDEKNIVVSVSDESGYAIYVCDLESTSQDPISKTPTNGQQIFSFFKPTDINHDGKVDLLSLRDYGSGELNVFYQQDALVFDADYRAEMNTANPLTDQSLSNALLDDIDNDGSLEIVTVNGENIFSFINLK